VPWDASTTRYTAQYLGYLKRLHVVPVTDHPKCSQYIPQMVAYIQDLVAADRAYMNAIETFAPFAALVLLGGQGRD